MSLQDIIRKRIISNLNKGGNITVDGARSEKINFNVMSIEEIREKFLKLFT